MNEEFRNGFNGTDGYPPIDPMSLSWNLFVAGGDPAYYMLYSDLRALDGEEDERRFD